MLVSPKPLFKMKLTHQGDGRVCKHESYLLAGWQEWFITFTDLGEAEWGDELGQEMVTKDGEKEARTRLQSPQTLPPPESSESSGETGKKQKASYSHPGPTCPLKGSRSSRHRCK